jgi:hypothetical protein
MKDAKQDKRPSWHQRLVRPLMDFFRWSARNPPAHVRLNPITPELGHAERVRAINEGIAEMNRHIEQLIRDNAPEVVVKCAINDRTQMIAPKPIYLELDKMFRA